MCLLSPAHILACDETVSNSEHKKGSEDGSDYEFSAFTDEPDSPVDTDTDMVDITSHGSVTPGEDEARSSESDQDAVYDSQSDSLESASGQFKEANVQALHGLATVLTHPSQVYTSLSLDYVLFRKPSTGFDTNSLPHLDGSRVGLILPYADDIRIAFCNTSGILVRGLLRSQPSYMRFVGSETFEQVYPVELEGHVAIGDSGSIVYSLDNARILGIVVARSTGGSSNIAFVVPASRILQDIHEMSPQEKHAPVNASALGGSGLRQPMINLRPELPRK